MPANRRLFSLHHGKGGPTVFSGTQCLPGGPTKGWVDGSYEEAVVTPGGGSLALADSGMDLQLFAHLGGLVGPGGSLMVTYEVPGHGNPLLRRTARSLLYGVPGILTHLGALLLAAGCWAVLRDWYIAEGGMEGSPKLQGFKPRDGAHARAAAAAHRTAVKAYLLGPGTGIADLDIEARSRVAEIGRTLDLLGA